MIELIETKISENTYANLGEMIDPILINKKINIILKKNIDLRRTNIDKRLYVNIGDPTTAEEINNAYNN